MIRHLLVGSAAVAVVATCTTDTTVGPESIASLSVAPDSAEVVVGGTAGLIAVAYDSNGVPFVGVPTTWASTNAAVATVSAVGLVTGVASGATMITATAEGLSATAMVTVVPPPVITLSRSSVTFTAVANGPDPAQETVSVTNGGGSTLTGLVVDPIIYGPGASGWLTAALDVPSAPATLTLTAATTGLAVGGYSATVRIASPGASNNPQDVAVTFTVGVGAPTQVAADSGDGQTGVAGTAVAIRPSVIVRDQYNNPVPGVVVTFAVASGGGTVAPITAIQTDASGRARVTSWVLGTTVGPNSLTATSGSLAGSPVTFSATGAAGPPAALTKAGGDGQSTTVNTAVATPPTVQITDQFGNPVSGVAVTFAVAPGNGSITGATQTADAAGIATVGSWTLSTTAGTNTLTATAGAFSASFTATGIADVATAIALAGGDGQTDTVAATLPVAYTVRVTDQYGNGVSTVTVTWGATGGGSITPSSPTNSSGIASATRVLGIAAGPHGATAAAGVLSGSPVGFTATATHGVATQFVKFAGDGQSATVDSAVALPPAVQVTDQYGNPVAGVAVTFAVASGGGIVNPTTPITTNASGVAAVTSWRLGSATGPNSLTASASGFPGLTFNATANSGLAKNLLLVSGDAQTDTIGATLLPYVVKVTDVNSNGVPGVGVSWLVTGGGGTITLNSTTDVNGNATATRVLGTVAGPASAQASVGGLSGSPQTFTATVLHGNAATLAKNAGDGQSVTVGTAVATPPQAKVTDRAGNVVAGVNVTLAVASGGGSISPASPATIATDGNGLATLTSWTLGTTAGSNTVTATASGLTGSPATFSATGTPDVPNSTQSTVVDNAATITACSTSCTVLGGTADSVTVTVRDQYGNLVGAGIAVTVSATGTSNTFTPTASGTTNASSVFATKLNSTVAQAKTISATAGGTPVTQTAAVTVNPAAVSAAQSSVVDLAASITACSASCTVAGGTADSIIVTVRDAFTNLISTSVTVSSNGSNNTFSPSATGTSNASGVFATRLSSTTAQAKTISATANAVAITQTAAVTVNAAAPASIVVNGGNLQSARVGTAVATDPSVLVRDAFLNPVPTALVTFSPASGGGSVSGGSQFTNSSGIATVTSWTLGGTNPDDAIGRMLNTLSASNASAGSTSFTGYGIYTWASDVEPLIGPPCTGCHDVVFDRTPTNTIVGVFPTTGTACDASSIPRVTASNSTNSLIYRKLEGTQSCGVRMPQGCTPGVNCYNTSQLKIVRAWINNAAQAN